MLKIDGNLLCDLGVSDDLPLEQRNMMLRWIYETLEMRVGMCLADQMSNRQLDEFEAYFEARDDQGAFTWLETNFPNYKDIVQEQFDNLCVQVREQMSELEAVTHVQLAGSAQ
jgi:hypothetical protein